MGSAICTTGGTLDLFVDTSNDDENSSFTADTTHTLKIINCGAGATVTTVRVQMNVEDGTFDDDNAVANTYVLHYD